MLRSTRLLSDCQLLFQGMPNVHIKAVNHLLRPVQHAHFESRFCCANWSRCTRRICTLLRRSISMQKSARRSLRHTRPLVNWPQRLAQWWSARQSILIEDVQLAALHTLFLADNSWVELARSIGVSRSHLCRISAASYLTRGASSMRINDASFDQLVKSLIRLHPYSAS